MFVSTSDPEAWSRQGRTRPKFLPQAGCAWPRAPEARELLHPCHVSSLPGHPVRPAGHPRATDGRARSGKLGFIFTARKPHVLGHQRPRLPWGPRGLLPLYPAPGPVCEWCWAAACQADALQSRAQPRPRTRQSRDAGTQSTSVKGQQGQRVKGGGGGSRTVREHLVGLVHEPAHVCGAAVHEQDGPPAAGPPGPRFLGTTGTRAQDEAWRGPLLPRGHWPSGQSQAFLQGPLGQHEEEHLPEQEGNGASGPRGGDELVTGHGHQSLP